LIDNRGSKEAAAHFDLLISFGEQLVPKHIRRLVMLLVAFAVIFLGGKFIFTPKSFGVYGHYPAASVAEIAALHPTYASPDSFSAEYPKEYETWSAGIHKVVKCQICHTTVGTSQNTASLSADTAHPAATALPMPTDSRKLCVKCHEKIAGRPDFMPQIEVSSHAGERQCTACHNPHSPLQSPAGEPIALAGSAAAGTVDIAAGKKLSVGCAGCHGPTGVSAIATFPNLACQKQAYLVGALTDYQGGKRANPVMGGIAKGMSTADIANVAAYFAGLSCGQKP
jgi:cytochrome c553